MTNIKKNSFLLTLSLFCFISIKAQTIFPSSTWNNSINISHIIPPQSQELSGLYWNDSKKQLFVVCDIGKLIVLQFDPLTNSFTQVANINNLSGPEGVMQTNDDSNTFFTIDENSYQIRKYSLSSNYATVTLNNTWNLLALPSPMTNTANTGPEGIAFIPDWYLQRIQFVNSETGKPYISSKGMNGLIFIAHQNGGYVWVFDVNPNVNNDFLYVGKYKTAQDESCDLTFDKSTGLMYILHNTGSNYLEITDLSTTNEAGNYKFKKLDEYLVPNPPLGSKNIEGFALTPKYSNNSQIYGWFCRDVSTVNESADCLRWFYPIGTLGENIFVSTVNALSSTSEYKITVLNKTILIANTTQGAPSPLDINVYDSKGSIILKSQNVTLPHEIMLHYKGLCYISISKKGYNENTVKLIIK